MKEAARPVTRGCVSVEDILSSGSSLSEKMKGVTCVEAEYGGHMVDAIVDAMDPGAVPKKILQVLDDLKPKRTLIITATGEQCTGEAISDIGVTVAVFRLSSHLPEYWVFDSHGAKDCGRSCLLVECATSLAAENVLREQLPSGLFSAVKLKHL